MRLREVNSTDIPGAIRLGCRTMENAFDADDNDVPFFDVVARPEARLAFSPQYSEAHVPGRHLNAMLNAEEASAIDLDEEAIEKHTRAAFLSYSGPVALPLNRAAQRGEPVNFAPHNLREGFHALYALAKYRDSAQARSIADASIAAIFEYWTPEGGWNFDRLEDEFDLKCRRDDFIRGIARAIGPLVKYYRATGHGPALELATVLKDCAIEQFFGQDGRYDGERFGHHTHSTTCVMSSLAQLADLTSDSALMDRVKTFYDNGLWDIRDAFGWVIESSRGNADPDRGEVNNSGDILETALILGRWGHTECFDDAERILRGHILPSQLRDVSFIRQPPNPENVDGRRDVADRLRGAFGFPAPYGHEPRGAARIKFNMDIVGGAVGSLCEALREAVTLDDTGHRVNLLFDHGGPEISVQSPYAHPALRVMVKEPAPLYVRIPRWVDRDALTIDGVHWEGRYSNGYAFIAEPPVSRWLSFSFPMAESEVVLGHRTREIRARIRGDEVIAMDSFGADLTFFDPFE